MRFELEIQDREGPMGRSAEIRRYADGNIGFDFYRRRAVYEWRMAKRVWLKNTLRMLAQFAQGSIASLRTRAADRSAPVARCCLAAERVVCCA